MKLYHGTGEAAARNMIEYGISPRGKRPSNWKAESRDDCVYLTTAYAPYFAFCSCDEGERMAILEVDASLLDEESLLPDEDWLLHVADGELPEDLWEGEVLEKVAWFRDNLTLFRDHWKDSVEHLGNVAYRGTIPPEAITRAALYCPQSNKFMSLRMVDPLVSPINYALVGSSYRAMTKWFFEDVEARDIIGLFWDTMDDRAKIACSNSVNTKNGIKLIKE